MYPASGAFQTAIWQDERTFQRRITIDTVAGPTPIVLLNDKLLNMSIRDAVVSGQSIEVGSAVCKELEFTISNLDGAYDGVSFIGAVVDVEIQLNALEWIPMGKFFVDVAPRPGKQITVQAFDGMIKFDKAFTTAATFPISALQVLQACCTIAGITLSTTSFPNSNYMVQAVPDNLSCRQIVQYVAQLAGCFAQVNRSNQLVLRWYTATAETVSASRVQSIVVEEAITITGVIYLDEAAGIEYIVGTDEYAIELALNPLLTDGINTVLTNIGAVLIGTTFTPGEAVHKGNPCWDAGDIVTIGGYNAATYTFLVGDNWFNLNGFQVTTKSVAESEVERGYASVGILTKNMSIVRQQVKELDLELQQEVSTREQAILDINETLANMGNTVQGHVLQREHELLIMDNADPELAVKIWRWNLLGLAYSDNVVGADNPSRLYTVAMTMDGQIIANFISTGTMAADIVRTGLLASVGDVSWLNLDNGQFAFGPNLTWNGTVLNVTGNINVTGGNAETTSGSQAKADAAEASAKTYAELEADTAEAAAKTYAEQQAAAAEAAANLHADAIAASEAADAQAAAELTAQGYVSAETLARQQEAAANLLLAEQYADDAAAAAEAAANAYTDAVDVGGTNLIVLGTLTEGAYLTSTGAETILASWCYTDFIPVQAGKQYIASGYINLGTAPATCFYDINKFFVSGIQNNNAGGVPENDQRRIVTVPTGCAYMRFSFELQSTGTIKLERGNKATDWSPSPQDVQAYTDTEVEVLDGRIMVVEFKTTNEQIVNTVTQSDTFQFLLSDKLSSEDLEPFATHADVLQVESTLADLQAQVNDLDLSEFVTGSQLTQTAADLVLMLERSGGVNMLRNSIGFAGILPWVATNEPAIGTVQSEQLRSLGYGSGFTFLPDLAEKILEQEFTTIPGVPHTFSCKVLKAPGASNAWLNISLRHGTTVLQQIELASADEPVYAEYKITFTPTQATTSLRFYAATETNAIITGSMVNLGESALQWTSHTEEIYNSVIKMDIYGIKVSQFVEGVEKGYTRITPDEFAGYYDSNGDGIFEKVFYLQEDETVSKKVKALEEITLGTLKVIALSTGTNTGWAFVPTTVS